MHINGLYTDNFLLVPILYDFIRQLFL